MPTLSNIGGAGKGLFGFGGGFGASTLGDIGGAVSDLFAAGADSSKSQADRLEGQNYGLAADLATQNANFTEQSTAIKQAQLARQNTLALGQTEADIAGAGFAQSGSALDLLRSSAQQGALTAAVAQQQGLITEAGYKEQAQSFRTMQQEANIAADAEDKAASGATISSVIKGVAAIATLV